MGLEPMSSLVYTKKKTPTGTRTQVSDVYSLGAKTTQLWALENNWSQLDHLDDGRVLVTTMFYPVAERTYKNALIQLTLNPLVTEAVRSRDVEFLTIEMVEVIGIRRTVAATTL